MVVGKNYQKYRAGDKEFFSVLSGKKTNPATKKTNTMVKGIRRKLRNWEREIS